MRRTRSKLCIRRRIREIRRRKVLKEKENGSRVDEWGKA